MKIYYLLLIIEVLYIQLIKYYITLFKKLLYNIKINILYFQKSMCMFNMLTNNLSY